MLLCFHTANNMVLRRINKQNKKKKRRKSYINIQDDLVAYRTPAKLLIVIFNAISYQNCHIFPLYKQFMNNNYVGSLL